MRLPAPTDAVSRAGRWPKRHPFATWVLASVVVGAGSSYLVPTASAVVLDAWGGASFLGLIAWLTVALVRDHRAVLRVLVAHRRRRALGVAALLLIAVGGTLYGIGHAQPGVTHPGLAALAWALVGVGLLLTVAWLWVRRAASPVGKPVLAGGGGGVPRMNRPQKRGRGRRGR